VADAQSSDDTVTIANQYDTKIIDGGTPAVGKNNGAEVSTAETLLFLDADVEFLEKDCLEKAFKEFTTRKLDFSFAHIANLSKQYKFQSILFNLFINVTDDFGEIPLGPCKAGTGFFIMVKKEIFESVGGFPEDLEYAEDTELLYRVFRKG
jgi:GT2 family glycosyltransferase